MSGYKDFPPGWNHVLVPTGSRGAARAGLGMYTPAHWKGRAAQRAAWLGVGLLGARAIPGPEVPWEPPMSGDDWQALRGELVDAVGRFDAMAVYERREGRPGMLLLLIDGATPVGFVKAHAGDGAAIALESQALTAMWRAPRETFRVPRPLLTGEQGNWHYMVTGTMPPGLHRSLREAPPAAMLTEIEHGLGELPRPEGTPDDWRPAHGDLTPWNLRRVGSGLPYLIDWEEAGWAPAGADVAFYGATAGAVGVPPFAEAPPAAAVRYWIDRMDHRIAQRPDGDPKADEFARAILNNLHAQLEEST